MGGQFPPLLRANLRYKLTVLLGSAGGTIMSFSHTQGLRDALYRLRDTYLPPTAEEVQLFTQALKTDEPIQAEPEPIRLDLEMPIPIPELAPKPQRTPIKTMRPQVQEEPPFHYYPPEEVETRW